MFSGYEYTKGQYVVIDPAETAKLRSAPDMTVQIESFVPAGSVDPVYYSGSNDYLGPDGLPAQKPYALLHRVMDEQGLQNRRDRGDQVGKRRAFGGTGRRRRPRA